MNDSLIVYSVDYYKRHASERLLFAYKLKDAYSDYTSAGVEERIALLREAIGSTPLRSAGIRVGILSICISRWLLII